MYYQVITLVERTSVNVLRIVRPTGGQVSKWEEEGEGPNYIATFGRSLLSGSLLSELYKVMSP